MPYDQFVRSLIDPSPESEGFINGIIWRGAVSASQNREVQAAQNVTQVFLGLNFKCNSCHDSFISDWKLADSYGLAGVFAEKPMEMYRCEKPTGKTAPVKFLYPQLGKIDGDAPRAEKVKQLAALMTDQRNGRLARTIVNRLWARFFGRGIIEPVDEMDRKPWNADLLDWLAVDFADHGYDVKRTIALMLTSRAVSASQRRHARADRERFCFQGSGCPASLGRAVLRRGVAIDWASGPSNPHREMRWACRNSRCRRNGSGTTPRRARKHRPARSNCEKRSTCPKNQPKRCSRWWPTTALSFA
jgi:hypothetical protein